MTHSRREYWQGRRKQRSLDDSGAVLGDDGDREDEEDRDLGGEEDSENPCPDIDAAVVEQTDEEDRRSAPHPPGDLEAEQVGRGDSGVESEQGEEADAEEGIGDDRHERDADADRLAQPCCGVGVEGPSVAHEAGHRCESDREEDEHDATGEHGAGCADSADAERQRC